MLSTQAKPGKQFVTFLLIANVSLFFFHTLEGMRSVFGDAATNARTKPFTILISAVAPLTVFYRFHSSVCLAEIWKHCYSVKNSMISPASDTGEIYSNRSNFIQIVRELRINDEQNPETARRRNAIEA